MKEAKLKAVSQISYENQGSKIASGPLSCMIFYVWRNTSSSYHLIGQQSFTVSHGFITQQIYLLA